ncbi:Ionotropic receptor 285 [Blattella germanica]|nr:Ionotropic receptor 285 [Blattella germanica]
MFLKIFLTFFMWYTCKSLLMVPQNNILEHNLAECVVKISLTYFDTNLPLVVHTPSTYFPPLHRNYKYGDTLIQILQSQGHLSIIVVGNRITCQTNVLKPGSVVIMIPPIYTAKDLKYISATYVMIRKCAENHSAKVAIVLSDENEVIVGDKAFYHFLLNESFKFGYLDIIVLEPKFVSTGNGATRIIRVFGFTINEQRNICSQELDKINHAETWATEQKKFLLNSSLYSVRDKLNLRRCALKIFIISSFPYAQATKENGFGFIGPLYDFLYFVAKSINVKFLSINDKRVGDLYFPSVYDPGNRNIWYKFTYPYFGHDIAWYVPPGREIPRWQGLVRAFSPLLWSLILLTSSFGTLTMWLLQKSERHSTAPSDDGILAALSSALLTHLGASVAERNKGIVAVLFFMLWLYYCQIINTAYRSALFGLLVYPGHLPPILTIKELVESGLIMERQYTVTYARTGFWWEQMQYKMCKGSKVECMRKVAIDHTHALTGTTWIHKLYGDQYRDTRGNLKLVPLKELVGRILVCLDINRFFVFLVPVFNTIISRIVSSGLFFKWMGEDILRHKLLHKAEIVDIESVMVFSLYQLEGEFYLLLIGFVLASLAFIVECFFHFLVLWVYVITITAFLDSVRLM